MLMISNNNGDSGGGSDKLLLLNDRHCTFAVFYFQYRATLGFNLMGCSPGCSEEVQKVQKVSCFFGQVFCEKGTHSHGIVL